MVPNCPSNDEFPFHKCSLPPGWHPTDNLFSICEEKTGLAAGFKRSIYAPTGNLRGLWSLHSVSVNRVDGIVWNAVLKIKLYHTHIITLKEWRQDPNSLLSLRNHSKII